MRSIVNMQCKSYNIVNCEMIQGRDYFPREFLIPEAVFWTNRGGSSPKAKKNSMTRAGRSICTEMPGTVLRDCAKHPPNQCTKCRDLK